MVEIAKNIGAIVRMNVTSPPLLAHFIPAVLAIVGWSRADQVARAGVLFGLCVLVPIWFVGSNFHEVRAQLPLTILLLPAAMLGLQRLVHNGDAVPNAGVAR